MAEKERKKAELEAIDGPRLFNRADGTQGKAWTLFFDGFKAEVYSDKGFEAAKALKGQIVEVEIEYKGEYMGSPQYKVVSLPGHWESGGWKGGGKGGGYSPEQIKSIEAQNAAKVTAWLAQTSNPDASLDWFSKHLTGVQKLIREAGATVPEPSTNGHGTSEALATLKTALEGAIKDENTRKAFVGVYLTNKQKGSLEELTEEEISAFLDAVPQPQES